MDALRTHDSYNGILVLIQISVFQRKEVYVRGFFFHIINIYLSLNLLPTISETKKSKILQKQFTWTVYVLLVLIEVALGMEKEKARFLA